MPSTKRIPLLTIPGGGLFEKLTEQGFEAQSMAAATVIHIYHLTSLLLFVYSSLFSLPAHPIPPQMVQVAC